jgi:hypothetical protein
MSHVPKKLPPAVQGFGFKVQANFNRSRIKRPDSIAGDSVVKFVT